MFNTGGVEVEVGELLYALVRVIKCKNIVETGTHLGISAAYMAQAIKDNQVGRLTTYEIIPSLRNEATLLWHDLGLSPYIASYLVSSLSGPMPNLDIDFLFLDSEPQHRFDEFIRFWPMCVPGCLIVIHDLHASLGHHGQTHHGVYDWPYGDFKDKLGPYLQDLSVQTVSLPTPRGLTIFQKEGAGFEANKYIRENLQ
jgi:predicted O-methyltransferase YrrM